MGNATKDASPRMGSNPPPPPSSFLGAAGREGLQAGEPLEAHSTALPSSPLSPQPGREAKPRTSHGGPAAAREGPLTSGAGSVGPCPGTTSSLCNDPPSGRAGGRHRFGSVPRAIHHGPLSRRPTLSREAQTPGKGRARQGPQNGLQLCLLSAGLLDARPAGRQAALGRKVAQLAGQVCLSSNRTQEAAQAC